MKQKAARSIGALLLGIGVLMGVVWGFTGTGNAGTAPRTQTTACVPTNHGTTTDISVVPQAKVELTGDGVKITTTDIPGKVSWKRSFSPAVDADEFQGASYTLTKLDDGSVNAAALPAFHIYVKVGGSSATLVYEPYYQIVGNPVKNVESTWVITGSSKFWTSSSNLSGITAEGGGSYAGNKTWNQINAANPTMEIAGYGWGQGTYNAGTVSLLNDVKFKTGKKCEQHRWSTRFAPNPSQSSSKPPTGSASASSTASASATAIASSSSSAPVTTPVGNDTLPLTGEGSNKPLWFTLAGVLIALLGVAAIWVGTRRRVRFHA